MSRFWTRLGLKVLSTETSLAVLCWVRRSTMCSEFRRLARVYSVCTLQDWLQWWIQWSLCFISSLPAIILSRTSLLYPSVLYPPYSIIYFTHLLLRCRTSNAARKAEDRYELLQRADCRLINSPLTFQTNISNKNTPVSPVKNNLQKLVHVNIVIS